MKTGLAALWTAVVRATVMLRESRLLDVVPLKGKDPKVGRIMVPTIIRLVGLRELL